MASARLLSLTLERFKSYRDRTVIPLHPLTVIVGRNNSGKSTIIQALLLLKQTLELPRPEVPLHLEGYVDALSLRELTYGWPEEGESVQGPTIGIRWVPNVDYQAKVNILLERVWEGLLSEENVEEIRSWNRYIEKIFGNVVREFRIEMDFFERRSKLILNKFLVCSSPIGLEEDVVFEFDFDGEGMLLSSVKLGEYNLLPQELHWSLEHFFVDKFVGPAKHSTKTRTRILSIFAALKLPLMAVFDAIEGLAFLGSMRSVPPTLYRPATVPPRDLGASGEYAAHMLQARRGAQVHYLPPLRVSGEEIEVPKTVRVKKLVDAVNDVYRELGIEGTLDIDDIRNAGFRLLFGKANLQHVGRGLSYLLPVVQLGLLADPERFQGDEGEISLEEYEEGESGVTLCALEEPEIHLHPKIQSQLAHWFVSLAMARRQLLVETHSDHLVRRLRGLAARAKPGSELETWLLENVRILMVDQQDGQSTVQELTLTAQGGLEQWPADFMDAATDEEREIFHASLDKPADTPPPPDNGSVVHDEGEEPETES